MSEGGVRAAAVRPTPPVVRVTTARAAAAADRRAISAGVPSRALMQRAGAAAAAELALRWGEHLGVGVAVHAGTGNNGGDAWVVAAALAAAGHVVRVRAWGGEPRTEDARAEYEAAVRHGPLPPPRGDERVVVDGLLGTGATGAPRGWAADGIGAIQRARAGGARVAALDLPSGVDATTGVAAGDAVTADLTLAFGTLKRGALVARDRAGTVVLLDIGLEPFLEAPPTTLLTRPAVPATAVASHKGTRRKLAVLGGAPGMAGAAILAGRAAVRSGVGMVRLVVAPASLAVVQAALPEALASVWPEAPMELAALAGWADAWVVGPGLGASPDTRRLVEQLLASTDAPVLLDADALNVFAGEAPVLATHLAGRAAIVTPHPLEFARLSGRALDDVLAGHFEIGAALSAELRAAVLLKGVPTVVHAPDGRSHVVATGTPALAAAGSGDVLAGIAGTLLAQHAGVARPTEEARAGQAALAAGSAAWVHGRAAEWATRDRGQARGVTLADVIDALPRAWGDAARPTAGRYPVLAELPAVPT